MPEVQMAEYALSMKDLQKTYHAGEFDVPVLKGINLHVRRGEFLGIMGSSGSGKSTLLNILGLLDKPTGGSYLLDGQRVETMDDSTLTELRNLKIGFIFQAFNLFPHMSVLNNIIDAPVHVLGVDRKVAVAEAMRLLEKMDLADHADAYPCELSGGQQQRVAIARALALHPEILFFDEPTSALDPELTQGVLRVIRALAEENMTMIIVTHEMDFAEMVADRIVFMADGVVVEDGSAEQVINNPVNERTKAFIAGLKAVC